MAHVLDEIVQIVPYNFINKKYAEPLLFLFECTWII